MFTKVVPKKVDFENFKIADIDFSKSHILAYDRDLVDANALEDLVDALDNVELGFHDGGMIVFLPVRVPTGKSIRDVVMLLGPMKRRESVFRHAVESVSARWKTLWSGRAGTV